MTKEITFFFFNCWLNLLICDLRQKRWNIFEYLQCITVQCFAVQLSKDQFFHMNCTSVGSSAVQMLPESCLRLMHYTGQYWTALTSTEEQCIKIWSLNLHCTTLHCTSLNCTAHLCTALHRTALHFPALYCIALHYIGFFSFTLKIKCIVY